MSQLLYELAASEPAEMKVGLGSKPAATDLRGCLPMSEASHKQLWSEQMTWCPWRMRRGMLCLHAGGSERVWTHKPRRDKTGLHTQCSSGTTRLIISAQAPPSCTATKQHAALPIPVAPLFSSAPLSHTPRDVLREFPQGQIAPCRCLHRSESDLLRHQKERYRASAPDTAPEDDVPATSNRIQSKQADQSS